MKITGAIIILLSWLSLGKGETLVTYLEPNCGTVVLMPTLHVISQGDETADILQHPWMASLRSKNVCPQHTTVRSYCTLEAICGGSLITAQFVLTAAHCHFNEHTTALLGSTDNYSPSESAIEIQVVQRIPHPNYNAIYLRNDIALFRLAKTVQYTDYIRPICLTTNRNPLQFTTNLAATGWGITQTGTTSNVLKTTTLKKLHFDSCSSIYNIRIVDGSQFCAGNADSNTGQGDSGGPITAMYAINGTNRVIQLGMVSYGEYPDPSVYTNVWHYVTWIARVVGRNIQQTPRRTQRPSYAYRPRYNNRYVVYG
ncbi:chymotrypsin-like protease CTRL-1 [Drosophila kikkawai]|uniref:Chymotrypsin-like protease CTRL-1 n=1 Tax=Drosophila kikkawai TaxID=30033 RepID=A0A6P4I0D0_DROKI|nr:chymotrypsin-like protease CTRL-1 [Drosophila kikkawai]